jgi:hypothetical protein
VFDDGPTKVVRIRSLIGARPIFAAGNANGDLQMLKIATWNAPASMALVVDHDDSTREPAYTSGAEKLTRHIADRRASRVAQYGNAEDALRRLRVQRRLPGRR